MGHNISYDVFISKNSKDSDVSREIAEFLDMAGYTYFESEISLRQLGKSEYVDKIYEAIDASINMIVICGPNERGTGKEPDSEWVKEEYSTFINEKNSGRKEGNIIVLLVGGINPSELDIRLRSKECISYSDYKSKLLDYIKKEDREEKSEEERLFANYFKKANQGDLESQLQLAICYDYGKGVKENQELAYEWYKRAAESGYSIAQYKLWSFMRFWRNPKKEVSHRYKWDMMHKALSSLEAENKKEKNPEKLYYLAVIYIYLSSINKKKVSDDPNLEKAFYYSLESAQMGFAEAQSFVGLRFERGEGTKKDILKALEWYIKSAEQGNKYGMYHAARLSLHEEIKDYGNAIKWLQRAAGLGHIESSTMLADLYFIGEKVSRDYRLAFRFYNYGAEHGNAHCQERLAYCLENGYGCEVDISAAVDWYKKSAERGDADAQFAMGEYRSYRHSVKDVYKYSYHNDVEAIYWFRKAADQGHLAALSKLSRYAEEPNKSIYYQCIAASMGNHDAIDALGAIGEGELYGNGEPILDTIWAIRETRNEDPLSLLAEFYYKLRSVKDGYDENTGEEKYRVDNWNQLVERAKNGDDQAAYAVSRACYVQSPNTNFKGLLQILTASAERGYAPSQNLLGVFYINRYSLPEDTEYDWEYMNEHKAERIAMDYWKKAALKGEPEAELNYGMALYWGCSGVKDKENGMSWIMKSVNHGCINAYKVYMRITKGLSLDSYKNIAFKCLMAIAPTNYYAYHALGSLFERSNDFKTALYYYLQGADKGDARSMYGIYTCVKYGDISSVSFETALNALYSAARLGYGWAIERWIEEQGGNPKDPNDPETVKWIDEAQKNGWEYTQYAHDKSISWI